jgi:hypothetical protein
MRWPVAIACAAALLGGAALITRGFGLWDDRAGGALVDLPEIDLDRVLGRDPDPGDRGLSGSACERLSELAALISIDSPEPREFLRRLGREAAGIHSGPRGLVDLARGGRDLLPGRGFKRPYDDGTEGQARHFAGVAVAASYGGEQATRVVSIFVRRDPLNSADGRLTEEALAFSRGMLNGQLEPDQGGEWILDRICRDTL